MSFRDPFARPIARFLWIQYFYFFSVVCCGDIGRGFILIFRSGWGFTYTHRTHRSSIIDDADVCSSGPGSWQAHRRCMGATRSAWILQTRWVASCKSPRVIAAAESLFFYVGFGLLFFRARRHCAHKGFKSPSISY